MYIVADVGGTKTRIAKSADLASFDEPQIFDTVTPYDAGILSLIERVRAVSGGEKIEQIAMGLPGTQARDHRSAFISGTATLDGWSGKPVVDELEAALSTQVTFENDTAMVGLGEAVSGAGRGVSIVVYVTVSTGVGGVRIVDGRLDPVSHGSEMGGQYLGMDAAHTLEGLVSGNAVYRKYGKHPKELGKESPVWEELAEILAYGLYNSLVHWSPDCVVLGGSMFNEIGISVERVRAHLARINVKLPEVPEMVHSALGDIGGLYGGLARLKQLR